MALLVQPRYSFKGTLQEMNHNISRHILDFPEMDTQHGYLFDLFEMLPKSSQVEDPAKTKLLLDEIERYVLFHIAAEEHLMRMYSFPGFSAHQSDHESFESKLIHYLDDFESGTLNPAKMRLFMSGWLNEHSLISDTEYVQWVKNKRATVASVTVP